MNNRRYYDMPAHERDVFIKNLRRQGYSLRVIGKVVGMTAGGVLRALGRIEDGRPGLDPRA